MCPLMYVRIHNHACLLYADDGGKAGSLLHTRPSSGAFPDCKRALKPNQLKKLTWKTCNAIVTLL